MRVLTNSLATFLCLFPLTMEARASVFEFADDGTITKFEASDYLSRQRHLKFPKTTSVTKYQDLISKYSAQYGVSADLINAVIKAESSYIPDAVSSKGAQGLMQLMPETAINYGVSDSFDAEENIKGGVHLLSDLLEKYEGSTRMALAAYNAGEPAVQKYGGIPPYRETVEYIHKIETFMARSLD